MKLLEERILREGKVGANGVLKVDGFLNHQLDVALLRELGQEFARLFRDCGVTKILTVEASGIAVACLTAEQMGVNVVFAKKSRSRNLTGEVLTAPVESFTRGGTYDVMVSREFLKQEDRVLLIDDFLASGSALEGLLSLTEQAGCSVAGAGVCVEKAFQKGGARLRSRGLRVEALARIESMDAAGGIVFCRETD